MSAPRLAVHEIERAPDATGALARLSGRRACALLDGAGWGDGLALLAFDPRRDVPQARSIADVRVLARRLAPQERARVPGPFGGGFVGAFAYDLGVQGERRVWAERDPWDSPKVAGGVYTDFLVLDERARKAWLVLDRDAQDGRANVEQRRAQIVELLAAPAPALEPARALGELVSHVGAAEHEARVEALRARIAAGDLYQANLARRFSQALAGDPRSLYARLRAVNPAPWSGYLDFESRDGGRGALLSASPELLLDFENGVARTRPIKGTAPRGANAELDRQLAAKLASSAKDQAELAMIVDLERNDLGRCALPGGVRVEQFPRLESYASVHHLVADVVAAVRPELDALDVLAALFPGGSISGAPKLAAMRAIAELEGEGRGFYTGSLGFVDASGRARWNVLIRTIAWRARPGGGGEVSFHAGGGVTWLSRAADEERETLHKAAGLVRALAPEPKT